MPDEENEDAREGKLLHDYSAHPEYDRRMLKPNQRDLLDLADKLTDEVIKRIEDELQGDKGTEPNIEDGSTGNA
jgi:hypothetical protein